MFKKRAAFKAAGVSCTLQCKEVLKGCVHPSRVHSRASFFATMTGGEDGNQLAVEDGVVASKNWLRRPTMELQLVRGSSFFTDADDDAVAGGGVIMDASVRGKMPEELMWIVVWLLPTVKLFQLRLVSRKWRQELTSTHFRKRLTESWAAQQQQERMVACVSTWPLAFGCARGPASGKSGSSSGVKVLKVDLSMVPNWFWNSFSVVAAGHGLLCISNESDLPDMWMKPGKACEADRCCVLNPLTHTCIVLPEPPFRPERWLLLTSTVVSIWRASGTAYRCATYDLATAVAGNGGGWVSAHKPLQKLVLPGERSASWWPPVGAMLGGETYWYTRHDNRVHMLAAGDEAEEVGALAAPSVTLLSLPDVSWGVRATNTYNPAFLVAHSGAVYFVAQLRMVGVVCGVWRLVRQALRMEWEGVAALGEEKLERLTGVTSGAVLVTKLCDAYSVRELVCCQLKELHVQGHTDQQVAVRLLGLNLDTGNWEVLNGGHQAAGRAFDLRPDLFLSS